MGKRKPLGVFELAPFHTQAAVFDDLSKLQKYHTKELGENPIQGINDASYGMCIAEEGRDGRMWYYLYIGHHANKYTRIHECSHLVDFVFGNAGVPLDMQNTEIRAYMLAYCCEMLDYILDGEDG